MTKLLVELLARFAAVISLLVVVLSFAPFTPAIFLTAALLPLAALTAWKRAFLPSAITALLCILAFFASPISWSDLLGLKPFAAWLFLCLAAVAGGFYCGSRPRKRTAV